MSSDSRVLEDIGDYKYGFRDPETYVFKSRRGLSKQVVEQISDIKGEPQWMLDYRLKALDHFEKRPIPTWGGDLSGLNLDNIFYYVKPSQQESKNWDEVIHNKGNFQTFGYPRGRTKIPGGCRSPIRKRNGIS
jgi:Fe-S cluster assembly protein SufB